MRPRLIAVDDEVGNDTKDAFLKASMRPRLIAVDDAARAGELFDALGTLQ